MRETSQCEWLNMKMAWQAVQHFLDHMTLKTWLFFKINSSRPFREKKSPVLDYCVRTMSVSIMQSWFGNSFRIIFGSWPCLSPYYLSSTHWGTLLLGGGRCMMANRHIMTFPCHTPPRNRLGLQWQQSNVRYEIIMHEGFSHGEIFIKDIHSGWCWLIFGKMLKTGFTINSFEIYHLQQSI